MINQSTRQATRAERRQATRRRRRALYGVAMGTVIAGVTVAFTVTAFNLASDDVPRCTDEIANAHGICQGIPTWEGDDLPAPPPGPEDTPETWVAGTPATTVYEDGSWRAADGTTGCTPGALCDSE